MTLPVPVHSFVTNPVQYTPGAPPVVPNVTIDADLQPTVPYVASLVANELSLHSAESALRIFSFNLAAINNWNTDWFRELTQFTIEFSQLRYRSNLYPNIDAAFVGSVSEAVALLSCDLVTRYPELNKSIDTRRLNIVRQNLPKLDNIKKELLAMNNSHYGQYNPAQGPVANQPHAPQHQQLWATDPRTGQMVPVVQGHPQYHQPQQPIHPDPRMGQYQHPNQRQMPPVMQPNMRHYQHPQQQLPATHHAPSPSWTSANSPQQPHPAFNEVGLSQGKHLDRYAAMAANRHQAQPTQVETRVELPPVINQPIVIPAEPEMDIEVEPKAVTVPEGSEVDRSRHQLKVFNKDYPMGTKKAYGRVTQAAKEMMLEAEQQTGLSYYLNPSIISTDSLGNAVANLRIKSMEVNKEGPEYNLVRSFAQVCRPVMYRSSMYAYLEKFSKSTSLVELRNDIQNILTVAKTMDEDDLEIRETIEFVLTLNNFLTTLLREFLKSNLGLALEIDGFLEDVVDIPDYLEENYGVQSKEDFGVFEKYLLQGVFNLSKLEKGIDDYNDLFGLEEEGGIHTVPLISDVSLTYVHYTYFELGYELSVGESLLIREDSTPLLYQISSTLFRDELEIGVSAAFHYLTTSDNVLLKLTYSYKYNSWMVSKIEW